MSGAWPGGLISIFYRMGVIRLQNGQSACGKHKQRPPAHPPV